MAKRSSRLKGILVVFASTLLAITVCAVFYYFKIKQNESYQNQLHFRELQNINTSINNGIGQFKQYSKQAKDAYNKIIESTNENNIIIKTYHLNKKALDEQIQEKEKKLKALLDEIKISDQTRKELNVEAKKLETANEELKDLELDLKETELAVLDEKRTYFEILEQIIEPLFDQENEYALRYDNECENDINNCLWLEQFVDEVISILTLGLQLSENEEKGLNNKKISATLLAKASEQSNENVKRLSSELIAGIKTDVSKIESNLIKVKALLSEIADIKVWFKSFEGQQISILLQNLKSKDKSSLPKYLNDDNQSLAEIIQLIDEFLKHAKDESQKKLTPQKHQRSQSIPPVTFTYNVDSKLLLRIDNYLSPKQEQQKDRKNYLLEKANLLKRVSDSMLDKAEKLEITLVVMYMLMSEQTQIEASIGTKAKDIKELEEEVKEERAKLIKGDSAQTVQLKKTQLETKELKRKRSQLQEPAYQQIEENNRLLKRLVSSYYSDVHEDELSKDSSSSRFKELNSANSKRPQWQKDLDLYKDCTKRAKEVFQICNIKLTDALNLSSPINTLLLESTALKNLKIKSYKKIESIKHIFENDNEESPKVLLDGDSQTIMMGLPLQQYGEAHHIDFMGEPSTRYPLVLLVNETGEVLVAKENQQLNAALKGVEFEQLNQIFKRLFKQQEPESSRGEEAVSVSNHNNNDLKFASTAAEEESEPDLLGYSGFVDVEIAGDLYRLFVSPYANTSKDKTSDNFYVKKVGTRGVAEKTEQLYLIGFRDKSNLVQAKLSLSRSLIIVAIFSFFALLAFIPLLKIRLVSQGQAFSNFDRHYTVIGLLLLICVLTVGGVCTWQYVDFNNGITKQSQTIFMQMRNRFNQEISLLTQYAEQQYAERAAFLASRNQNIEDFDDSLFTQSKNKEFIEHQYFLDNLFYLTSTKDDLDESTKLDGIARWSTEKTYRRNKGVSVKSREYATKALKNDIWPVSFTSDGSEPYFKGLFIERVFNLRDSRLTTQFSRVNAKQTRDNPQRPLFDVLSYGSKLQTFFNAVLPENFGFVVFETKTGKAMYHSDDKNRSLVENVYVETDNNPLFKAMKSNPLAYDQPVSFDAIYGGKMHHFAIADIHPNIPWKLAIFYDKEERRSVNLIAAVIALFVCFILCVIVYVCLLVFMRKRKRRYFFWPEYSENSKVSRRKLVINTSAITTVIILILLLISNEVFNLHEQRYAQVVDAKLAYKTNQAMIAHNRYRQLTIDPEGEDGKELFIRDLNNRIPCYLGGNVIYQRCNLDPISHQYKETVQSSQKRGGGFAALIEYFWSFSVLAHTIDESLTISQKLADVSWCYTNNLAVQMPCTRAEHKGKAPSKYLIDKKSIPDRYEMETLQEYNIVVWLVLLLVILVLFSILRVLILGWLFERLIGIDIPVHFRQQVKKHSDLLYNINADMFTAEKYALVIRPDVSFKKALFSQLGKDNGKVNPLVSEIINVGAWYKQPTIKTLEADIKEPNGINLVLNVGEDCHAVKALIDDDRVENITQSLLIHAGGLPLPEQKTLFIDGLENVANDKDKRLLVLDVLEHLVSIPKLSILIFCEVAPLYMLTKQSEYPCAGHESQNADSSEVKRWSNLFRQFSKIYQWSAGRKQYLGCHEKLFVDKVLRNEASGWPELKDVLYEFCEYHNTAKASSAGEETISYDVIKKCLDSNEESPMMPSTIINKYWQSQQIVEFFSCHAGALYRYRWELCTKAERLLLFQLANDFEPNPRNLAPIEHLTRRGYIYRDCGWHIINESFKQFVLTAEPQEVMEEWLAEANENIWRYLRIPFFALLIALLAILAYSATDAIESALGILTAILGLIPMAIRNFTLFKGG